MIKFKQFIKEEIIVKKLNEKEHLIDGRRLSSNNHWMNITQDKDHFHFHLGHKGNSKAHHVQKWPKKLLGKSWKDAVEHGKKTIETYE